MFMQELLAEMDYIIILNINNKNKSNIQFKQKKLFNISLLIINKINKIKIINLVGHNRSCKMLKSL